MLWSLMFVMMMIVVVMMMVVVVDGHDDDVRDHAPTVLTSFTVRFPLHLTSFL